ncbi:hypothetical protein KF728_21260 [Candidatus Obscuribacterales bacterium]|nr:hypothetical protein [Candidatus Obscuribacterales bacterium]MBX3152700.1 hypothetical protein [Candidatus Obscuribacterales bacterium]
MTKSTFFRTLALSICALNLQSCGDTTFLRYSQNLAEKAKGTSEKVQTFYGGLRKAHSQMRIDELKLQADAATPLDSAAPGPNCPFTSDDVANRVRSAQFIETYSVKMNELVHSRNPNEMQAAISDVSGQLVGFNIKNFNPLAALQSAGTPLTTGLKIAGRRGFAVWANRWLKQALVKSDSVFVEQSKLLKLELAADANEAITRATTLQGRAERVYRKKVAAHASEEEKQAALDEAQRISTFRDSVAKDNPSQTYDDLLDIHAQLMSQVPDKFKKK